MYIYLPEGSNMRVGNGAELIVLGIVKHDQQSSHTGSNRQQSQQRLRRSQAAAVAVATHPF